MPLTTPVEPMVASEVLLLLHVPPAVALLSVTDAPVHNPAVPFIAVGIAFTVAVVVTEQPVDSV